MQGTAQFHHEIADAVLPQPDPVFHDAAALDAAVDMLDPQPTVMQGLVGQLLLPGEALATGLLRRHEDRHLRERERQETQILQEPAPRRQGIRRRVRHGLIMGAATIGVAQKEDEEQGIDQQDIFRRVVSCLAAITLFLFNRVLGAEDAPLRPVMGKRGDAGVAAGAAATGAGSSASGVITVAASASETPSRGASAASERVGAAPILFILQLVDALTNGFRIARQDPRDVLDPTMPQLGRLYGRIPTSVLLRQPTEEALHLPFDICCIHFHAVLLDPELIPSQGYYGSSNPGSY